MTIYKCDRCGTIIESEYDVCHITMDDPEREPDRTGRNYTKPIKRDLCAKCAVKISEVLNG